MKVSSVLLSAAIIGTISIITISQNVLAWHPQGAISKRVQNLTTGSALVEADSAAAAVTAKQGDTLKYVITVSNNGTADDRGYNDMAKTVMTDTLPVGIELTASSAQRTISENIGTIKPGQSITKEYTVKVTTTSDSTIQNTACFTGNSTANDNPQQGCNSAFVKTHTPFTPATPTPTPTPAAPTTPTTPELPAELPHTGITENILGSAVILGVIYYAVHSFVASQRTKRTTAL